MSSGTMRCWSCVSDQGIITTMPDLASPSASATTRESSRGFVETTPMKNSTALLLSAAAGSMRSATPSPAAWGYRTSFQTGSSVNHSCGLIGIVGSTCGMKSAVRTAVRPCGVTAVRATRSNNATTAVYRTLRNSRSTAPATLRMVFPPALLLVTLREGSAVARLLQARFCPQAS